MVTLKPVILPNQSLKDGRHKIRIAVGHKHQTRYIITNLIIDSPNHFRDGQVFKHPDASALDMKIKKSYECMTIKWLSDLKYIFQ